VTAVIDQMLREVYAGLVLGCKMEIPVYAFPKDRGFGFEEGKEGT
jgi:hypothetical protein